MTEHLENIYKGFDDNINCYTNILMSSINENQILSQRKSLKDLQELYRRNIDHIKSDINLEVLEKLTKNSQRLVCLILLMKTPSVTPRSDLKTKELDDHKIYEEKKYIVEIANDFVKNKSTPENLHKTLSQIRKLHEISIADSVEDLSKYSSTHFNPEINISYQQFLINYMTERYQHNSLLLESRTKKYNINHVTDEMSALFNYLKNNLKEESSLFVYNSFKDLNLSFTEYVQKNELLTTNTKSPNTYNKNIDQFMEIILERNLPEKSKIFTKVKHQYIKSFIQKYKEDLTILSKKQTNIRNQSVFNKYLLDLTNFCLNNYMSNKESEFYKTQIQEINNHYYKTVALDNSFMSKEDK